MTEENCKLISSIEKNTEEKTEFSEGILNTPDERKWIPTREEIQKHLIDTYDCVPCEFHLTEENFAKFPKFTIQSKGTEGLKTTEVISEIDVGARVRKVLRTRERE